MTSDDDSLVMWEGRKVMILLPVYRTFCADTHYSLFANYAKYGPEKVGMEIIKRTMIHDARNMLIDKWMKTNIPTAIMWDDDMIPPCGNAQLFNGRYGAGVSDQSAGFNSISRLMSHGSDKGIVGMLYFGRHEFGQAQCEQGFGPNANQFNDQARKGALSGLVKTGWVGTGGIKIERWVIEKMKSEIDNGKWPECKPAFDGSWYGYFTPLGTRIGEDVSFGRRASQIGIQSYVDASLVALHVGECLYGPRNTRNAQTPFK